MREMAGTWSRIWSMGRIPLQIISALVDMKEGMTRPGQSHRQRPGSTNNVYNTQTNIYHRFRGLNNIKKIYDFLLYFATPISVFDRNENELER